MLKIYSIFDSKVGAYMTPIFFRSRGEAVRALTQAVNTADHAFSKNAEDFTLFELGEFDDLTSKFVIYPTPVSCGLALEYVNRS